jgi:phosphohistidine phosphatase
LIRHAEAAPLGEHGVAEDGDRPLTAKGEKQAEALGKMLAARGIAFDKVLSSPFVRAVRTAELMLQRVKSAPEVTQTDALTPNAKPRKLAKLLRATQGESIALVGHLPHIAIWAGWLIGAKKAQIDFAKSGIACVACGEMPGKGLGNLRWLVTPEWF